MGPCQFKDIPTDVDTLSASDEDGPWFAAGISEDHYEHIKAEFAYLDANGDHHLSRAEFGRATGLPEFLTMQSDDVQHLFDTLDADHSGDISLKEFLLYMSKRKDFLPLPIQVDPQKQRLEDNMELLGFEMCTTDGGMRGVKGDGNCQFYSLAWHLFSTTSSHHTVRAKAIEHLRGPGRAAVEAFYAPEHPRQPQTFEAYLDEMSKDHIWGDHFTLQAVAEVFNVRLQVLTAGKYNRNVERSLGQACGPAFGVVQTVVPQSTDQEGNSKDLWVGFAALHYSPIKPTARTPTRLLHVL
mmetsp:Transcript_69154/g.195949  ORF Transcript_69154/g.195949 Transcript_69154/m.195949 type:complete len:297 (-) Transcript_69154:90-980(-)